MRGADWKWGDQDGPAPAIGRVISELADDGWIRIQWNNGDTNSYRYQTPTPPPHVHVRNCKLMCCLSKLKLFSWDYFSEDSVFFFG